MAVALDVISHLGTKGTEDQPVHCLCEIRLWLFCLEHVSYHPSVTGSMAAQDSYLRTDGQGPRPQTSQ